WAPERPQFPVGTARADEFGDGRWIEPQVLAERFQRGRLVVDDRRSRLERKDVFFRGLRVHRDEEVDFLFASDVAVLARANRVPRRQARDIRGKHVLAGHRNAHEENRPQQYQVRRLTARAVDGGHLDAEVVDDALASASRLLFLYSLIGR